MKGHIALVCMFGMLLGGSLHAVGPKDFSGTYACKGTNPRGDTYTVWTRITALTAVLIVEQISNAGESFVGIGAIINDHLFAAFSAENYPSYINYTLKEHELIGEWGMVGLDKIMPERCRPTTDLPPHAPPPPPVNDQQERVSNGL